MNVLNRERINELIVHRSPSSVSLFMPTHRAGRERRQDRIRYKNLVSKVRERMVFETKSASAVDRILQPLVDLQADEMFWRHCADGLACFCAPDFFRAYRVPLELDEQLYINDRFYVRALLPLLRFGARFYILALSQAAARLFEATRFSIREVQLPEISPVEVDGDEQALQYHSHRAPAQGKGATDTAVYHGQGGPSDRTKKDALRFFHLVNRAVAKVLQGQHAPLVLACVGYLAPLYESANSYGQLIKGKVSGSPDRWNEDELREHAWQFVEPYFRQKQQEAWHTVQRSADSDRVSKDLRTIVLAADQGRVDSLFLVRGEQRWGHVDPELQAVQFVGRSEQAEELLDYAAVRALSNGGDVFLLDTLPEIDAPAVATFRY